MAFACQELDGIDDVVRFGVIHDPVQTDAAPARLQPAMPMLHG